MKKLNKTLKTIWKDESGQGATEYILLLVVIVGLATLFGGRIKETVTDKINEVSGLISGFSN